MPEEAPLGAAWLNDGRCAFLVWAPLARRVELHVTGSRAQTVPLAAQPLGYHSGQAEGLVAGDRYFFSLDGGAERPDPASRHQPVGVGGPSAIVDPAFEWNDRRWKGLPVEALAFYEVHVGAFTPQGTFDAIVPRLPELCDLGVTAIEIMPVAAFPGERNWGYDGVALYAVEDSYGGPAGLKRLVDACHAAGMAAFLDVVYNHLGPEGNFLREFGPYFTDRYRTPWGEAVNFDGPGSDEVRRFFLENARRWISEFHLDGLRLDAVHAIHDRSAHPFLEELAQAIHEEADRRGWPAFVVAESDSNDSRLVRPREAGGHGMDAQWSDDFHHALHALATGERSGYYQDFGSPQHLADAFSRGFVYVGQRSAYRQRRHGNSTRGLSLKRFVVCAQNHDQVGNRMEGERLSTLVDFESLKLVAAAVLLSPSLPLLFMGEEYGETAPFLYFVSPTDRALIEAVREGRRREFASFLWRGEPPDPQARETFERSKIDWALGSSGRHRTLRSYHRELLRLRREIPALAAGTPASSASDVSPRLVTVLREGPDAAALLQLAFDEGPIDVRLPPGAWRRVLDSGDGKWDGPGSGPPETPEEDQSLHFRGPRALLWLGQG